MYIKLEIKEITYPHYCKFIMSLCVSLSYSNIGKAKYIVDFFQLKKKYLCGHIICFTTLENIKFVQFIFCKEV